MIALRKKSMQETLLQHKTKQGFIGQYSFFVFGPPAWPDKLLCYYRCDTLYIGLYHIIGIKKKRKDPHLTSSLTARTRHFLFRLAGKHNMKKIQTILSFLALDPIVIL